MAFRARKVLGAFEKRAPDLSYRSDKLREAILFRFDFFKSILFAMTKFKNDNFLTLFARPYCQVSNGK